MNQNQLPAAGIETKLSVFPAASPDPLQERLTKQLPFLESLCKNFEEVTGWELEYQSRHSPAKTTLSGQLEITDLSANLPAGKSAAHRKKCEDLVQIIDGMILAIQREQGSSTNETQNLGSVVNVPFDWWDLDGKSGFCAGNFCGWGISFEEKLRLFSGRVQGDCSAENTIGSVAMLSAVECSTNNNLRESLDSVTAMCKRYFPSVDVGDCLFALEIDPITGSYQNCGNIENSLIVDVQAKTVVELPESIGNLANGEVLILSPRVNEKTDEVINLLQWQEMTCVGFRDRVKRLFQNDPHLILFRR